MRKLNVIESENAKILNLRERKYILTHSDTTHELFLYIVSDFNDYKFSEDIDEVFGFWESEDFIFQCFLDNENSKFSIEERYIIFKKHVKNSLISMMKGEYKLKNEDLNSYVIEKYISKNNLFNKILKEKTIYEYVYSKDGFKEYDTNFDYKSLK